VLRVGLTGGIACGKSHVLRRLAERGCRTLDLDLAAREVLAPGSRALAEVVAAFGGSVLDALGALDRPALAALVFADPRARERLNAIVHPRVRALEAAWAEAQPDPEGAVLVTDAALLIEAGAHLRFDRLVVVHCDEAVQLRRLRERDGLDEAAARARIEAQMPLAEKRGYAHFEIDTSGAPAGTDAAADAVLAELRRLIPSLGARAGPVEPRLLARLLGSVVHGPRAGPRGLSPAALLGAVAEQGGLELQSLAGRLEGATGGPWYRSARQTAPGAAATALSPALVAWTLASGPADPDYVVAAAASLARLTHDEPAPRADACLLAPLLQELALGGPIPDDLEARARSLEARAARWGGGPPSGSLQPVLRAALARRADPAAARAAARDAGGDGELAGALVGAAVGARPEAAPELARALGRIRPRRS
jgi:dephospho-CoA kinase